MRSCSAWLVPCCLLASLAGAAEPEATPSPELPLLVVTGLHAGAGIDASVATALTEALAREVGALKRHKVISTVEVARLLSIERQRRLLGCEEEGCMTELTNALGAQLAVSGGLARVGDGLQLTLQLLDAQKGTALGRSTRVATRFESLRDQLPFAVAELFGLPEPKRPSKVGAIVLMAAGGAGVVAGGILWAHSLAREEATLAELAIARAQPEVVLGPADKYRAEAQAVTDLRIAGSIAAAVGAALVVTGVLVLPGEHDVVRATLVPTPNGVAVSGVFP